MSEPNSQSDSAFQAIRAIDYTVIFVRDMAAMRRFYEHVLGFPLLRELSPRWVEYRVGNNTLALAIPGRTPEDTPMPVGTAALQLAFKVSVPDVDRCADELVRQGLALLSPPTDQAFGHRTLFFRDPDGNLLEVFADISVRSGPTESAPEPPADPRREIRPFRDDDEDATAAVWHRAGLAAHTYLPTWQARMLEHARRVFHDVIRARCALWVGTLNGQVVAYLALNGSYIDRLYVDPGEWRQGWGTRLVELAKTLSPQGLELHTHQANGPARALYEKHGFTAVRFGISPPPESAPDVEYHWRP